MNRSIMISIQPKWCELIANSNKTIEVRKTRPKIDTPFKCYIYCTKPKKILKYVFHEDDYPEEMRLCKTVFCKVPDGSSPFCSKINGNGKVIGEFVCDKIIVVDCDSVAPFDRATEQYIDKETCIDRAAMWEYSPMKCCYGWRISNLVIYDRPRELSEFLKVDNEAIQQCANRQQVGQPEYKTAHGGWIKGSYYCCEKEDWCDKCKAKPVIRPPQSWCYVEEAKK